VILKLVRTTVVAVKLVSLDRFLENVQISNFTKMPLWGPIYSIWTYRRAVSRKLTVAFRNFAKAPKNKSVNVLREIIDVIPRTTKKT
jgi:hypothetical protein